MLFKDFNTAYSIVAWLCWLPNLIIAHFFFQKSQQQKKFTASEMEIAL
jgi:hypothetical protein